MRKIFFSGLICSALILTAVNASAVELNLDKLSDSHIQAVKDLLIKLEPLIRERDAQENLARLTFDELYSPLNEEDQEFLKSFQNLDPKALDIKIPFRGFATGEEELVTIKGQTIKDREKNDGSDKELPPQFLPPFVYDAYLKMMEAMEQDIGTRLLIESGYRGSAYQLYLFVYYLKNHDYSIRETRRFVALPGYSEHGAPAHQAIDFINRNGINGEDNPQEFEDLPEYAWLLKRAAEFGFVLSYPKDAGVGITYEPWHWRYEPAVQSR